MSQAAVIERETSRQVKRVVASSARPEDKKARVIEVEAPSVERTRNVGGRLMV